MNGARDSSNGAWIGLSKSKDNCPLASSALDCVRPGWRWEDETPYSYAHWHQWSNYDTVNTERCVKIYHGPRWVIGACNWQQHYVCEKGMIIFIAI